MTQEQEALESIVVNMVATCAKVDPATLSPATELHAICVGEWEIRDICDDLSDRFGITFSVEEEEAMHTIHDIASIAERLLEEEKLVEQ